MAWKPTDRDLFLFWRKVDKPAPDACWPWRGIPDEKGYGHCNMRGWRTTAHRLSYSIANGCKKPRDSIVVMHTCDNRICCNPAHLLAGTQAQNLADMRSKGRSGDSRNFGEQHGRCKISDAQVGEIHQLRSEGWSQQRLATHFGVGQSQIGRILAGQSRVFGSGQYPVDRRKD